MTRDNYLANKSAMGGPAVDALDKLIVGVKGNGAIAQATIANLIGLGVGTIFHETESEFFSEGILRDLTNAVYPDAQTYGEALFGLAPWINYSNVRNGRRSRELNELSDAAIILNTNESNDSSLFSSNELDARTISYRRNHDKNCDDGDCAISATESLIVGSLLANEARKRAYKFSPVEQSVEFEIPRLNLAKMFNSNAAQMEPHYYKNVVVIGAGGLGTYCTYILAKRGVPSIHLYEPDIVEATNLNRQLFYTGCVGEKKATVLARRLSNSTTTIIPECSLFDGTQIPQNYSQKGGERIDAIFCCTDTLESRLVASDFAQKYQIPLVEGACTPVSGLVTQYVPGKSKTIAEQRNLINLIEANYARESAQKQRLKAAYSSQFVHGENHDAQNNTEAGETDRRQTSCVRSANPSVICPNVIIGALQAIALDARRDNRSQLISQFPQVFVNLMLASPFSRGGI